MGRLEDEFENVQIWINIQLPLYYIRTDTKTNFRSIRGGLGRLGMLGKNTKYTQ